MLIAVLALGGVLASLGVPDVGADDVGACPELRVVVVVVVHLSLPPAQRPQLPLRVFFESELAGVLELFGGGFVLEVLGEGLDVLEVLGRLHQPRPRVDLVVIVAPAHLRLILNLEIGLWEDLEGGVVGAAGGCELLFEAA